MSKHLITDLGTPWVKFQGNGAQFGRGWLDRLLVTTGSKTRASWGRLDTLGTTSGSYAISI
jgi:hypothetical protein